MNVDKLPDHVWIAEAFQAGDRVESVVHLTKEDAAEDIGVLTGDDARIELTKKRLHTGVVEDTEEL